MENLVLGDTILVILSDCRDTGAGHASDLCKQTIDKKSSYLSSQAWLSLEMLAMQRQTEQIRN